MVVRWEEVGYLNMLVGQHIHTLDEKKRLALPSKFRRELGKKVIVTNGLENCLFVYSLKEWQKFSENISSDTVGQADLRSFQRYLFPGAVETEVDKAGRILIPDFLKEFAGLKDKVVIAGLHNRAEIWNDKAWEKYREKVSKQADVLADQLGQIGMI